MRKPRLVKPSQWLIVTLGMPDRDIESIGRYVNHIKTKLKQPSFQPEYLKIDSATTHSIQDVVYGEGQLEEVFESVIFSQFNTRKKRNGIDNVAVVFGRNSFVTVSPPSNPLFDDMRGNYRFTGGGDIPYHLICNNGDFLNISNRIACVDKPCNLCSNESCQSHSCLLRLLYIMFEENKEVVTYAKELNDIE